MHSQLTVCSSSSITTSPFITLNPSSSASVKFITIDIPFNRINVKVTFPRERNRRRGKRATQRMWIICRTEVVWVFVRYYIEASRKSEDILSNNRNGLTFIDKILAFRCYRMKIKIHVRPFRADCYTLR